MDYLEKIENALEQLDLHWELDDLSLKDICTPLKKHLHPKDARNLAVAVVKDVAGSMDLDKETSKKLIKTVEECLPAGSTAHSGPRRK